MKSLLKGVVACAVMSVLPAASFATFTMTDGNSTAYLDPDTDAGMYGWEVDGVNQLFNQWFYYRVGDAGGEASIDTISAPVVDIINPRIASITYSNAVMSVDITYVLTGGTAGSGRSDIAESIRIINRTNQALDLHFFQYTDFDINGTLSGDTAMHSNANTFAQWEAGTYASETISTPVASHWQLSAFPDIIASLTDGLPTTLTDSVPFLGPADCSFAWQWDVTIGAGGSFLISKDKSIVPEPGSVLALGAGLGLLVMRRRKKSA